VVDEAQDLAPGVLEQLRLLSNLETAKRKLLQIIFVGQVEFEQKLLLPELRQLAQRITVRQTLTPLSMVDTAAYVAHRLSVASGNGSALFSKGALRRIHGYSRGYPRLINIICDRSLLVGFALQAPVITSGMVRKAARGLWGPALTVRKVKIVASRRVTLPIAALAFLLFLAVLLFWGTHRALPSGIDGGTSMQIAAGHDPGSAPPDYRPLGRTPDVHLPVQKAPAPRRGAPGEAEPVGAGRSRIPTGGASADLQAASEPVPDLTEARPYWLQVHSFATNRQAEDAAASLRKLGYPAFAKLLTNDDETQWLVACVGPYPTLEAVREAKALLASRENLHAVIRR
jgi:general secretion pathway protein A